MSVEEVMRQKINEAFSPSLLEIQNDSDKHQGHAGHDGSGESHFRIKIVSNVFVGKNRVERQRMVLDLLKAEMEERIHALSMQCQTPEEAQ